VDSSVLEYLVSHFGGFDITIVSDRRPKEHVQVLMAAQSALGSGDAIAATSTNDEQADEVWAALERGTRAVLLEMQYSREPLTDDHLPPRDRPGPPSPDRAWIIATFRHETDDETGDILPHTHNIVPAITALHWDRLRDPTNNPAAESAQDAACHSDIEVFGQCRPPPSAMNDQS
jgi:hypothetical protein